MSAADARCAASGGDRNPTTVAEEPTMTRSLSAVLVLAGCLSLVDAFADTPAPLSSVSESMQAALNTLSNSELRELRDNPEAAQRFLERESAYAEVQRRAESEGLLAKRSVQKKLIGARRNALHKAVETAHMAAHPPDQTAVEALARDYYAAYPDRFTSPRRVKLAHITIVTDPCEPEATEAVLAELRSRAEAGEDFAVLAKEHSEAPNAALGGLIKEWIIASSDTRSHPFYGKGLALEEVGAMTQPFEFAGAHHLVMLLFDTPEKQLPFEVVAAMIEGEILKQLASQERAGFERDLHAAPRVATSEELETLIEMRLSQPVDTETDR